MSALFKTGQGQPTIQSLEDVPGNKAYWVGLTL